MGFLNYCYTAREAEQKETVNTESSEIPTTSEAIITRRDNTSDHGNTETSNLHQYCSFPRLPLPPREYHYYGHKTQYGTVPTEDKMGTLHNAIIDTKQQPVPSSSSSQTSSDGHKGTQQRMSPNQSTAVRFVPRTTHLENRKRRMEEVDVTGHNEQLIGPKLPEPPKVDMEDESLNTTVSLIRNTMRKVGCMKFSFIFRMKPVCHCGLYASIHVSKMSLSRSSGGICSWPQTSGEKSETSSSDLIKQDAMNDFIQITATPWINCKSNSFYLQHIFIFKMFASLIFEMYMNMSLSLFHMFLKDMLLKCLNMLKKREETECQISSFQNYYRFLTAFHFYLPWCQGGRFQKLQVIDSLLSLLFQSHQKIVCHHGRGPTKIYSKLSFVLWDSKIGSFQSFWIFKSLGKTAPLSLPSSWVWSPPGLWFLRQGPPLWAAWWGCFSACETSPLWRCSCHHSSHTRENSLSHAKREMLVPG